MTPSRPAPSKRRNQSAATLESLVAGVRCSGGAADREQRLQHAPPLSERHAAQIAVPLAEQVEEHDRRRDLLRQQLHARRRRMKAQLQRVEVERAILARRRSRRRARSARAAASASGSTSSGKVAIERLLVAALNQDLVAVAKDQRAKAVPLRFEDPGPPAGSSPTRLASIGKTGGLTGRSITMSYQVVPAIPNVPMVPSIGRSIVFSRFQVFQSSSPCVRSAVQLFHERLERLERSAAVNVGTNPCSRPL